LAQRSAVALNAPPAVHTPDYDFSADTKIFKRSGYPLH
jgi:hypothetical protein